MYGLENINSVNCNLIIVCNSRKESLAENIASVVVRLRIGRPRSWGSTYVKKKKCVSFRQHIDWFQSAPSSMSNVYISSFSPAVKRPGCGNNHLSLFITKISNVWSCRPILLYFFSAW